MWYSNAGFEPLGLTNLSGTNLNSRRLARRAEHMDVWSNPVGRAKLDIETLVKCADTAMYQAKESGSNAIVCDKQQIVIKSVG